jgi:hypothetical protein
MSREQFYHFRGEKERSGQVDEVKKAGCLLHFLKWFCKLLSGILSPTMLLFEM